MFTKFFERVLHFLFEIDNDWEIGIINQPIQTIFKRKKLGKVNWLKMPRGVFWADPFGIKVENNYYLFYEEFNKKKGYGTINCMQLDENLNVIKNEVVIDSGSHLSFPFIFKENDGFYILPESCQANELSLYKAIIFPFQWVKDTVLIEEPCMDTIIFKYKNYWHLLYTLSKGPFQPHTLFHRKNTELKTNWSETHLFHFENNGFNSRGAGNIFEIDGKLYRASQNCKFSYGKSIVFNEVKIEENSFSEKACLEIVYNRFLTSGFHTISSCEAISFIDRRRRRLFVKNLSEIFLSLKKYLLRI